MDTEVRPLTSEHMDAAVGVLARGMRDNPNHIAVYGDDPEHRVAALVRQFGTVVPMQEKNALQAMRDGETVGVCGLAPPGECIGALFVALGGQVPPMSDDEAEQARIAEWLTDWAQRDLEERHFHLGPIAADAHLQGQGIGTALMEVFDAVVDVGHDVAYLETDKPENVRFYQRFGFETIADGDVLGVPNWFMRRAAR